MNSEEILPFLLHLSEIAASVTIPSFRKYLSVEDKSIGNGFDPVTKIDRDTEQALISEILSHYPQHSVLGEETGITEGRDSWTWIIDPIDGTRSYISGFPTWATLIGLLKDNVPIYGMMSQPLVKDCFIGGRGLAELVRPEARSLLKVRDYRSLPEVVLFSTSPDMFISSQEISAFDRLSKAVKLTRYGADSYGYCLLAAGCIDLVVEADLEYYDIAPLIPIVESAGGVVSDWEGNPVRSGGRVVAASTHELLDEALSVLAAQE